MRPIVACISFLALGLILLGLSVATALLCGDNEFTIDNTDLDADGIEDAIDPLIPIRTSWFSEPTVALMQTNEAFDITLNGVTYRQVHLADQ